MKLRKRIALMLAACLLASIMSTGLMEAQEALPEAGEEIVQSAPETGEEVPEAVEAEVAPAQSVDAATGLSVESDGAGEAPQDAADAQPQPTDAEADAAQTAEAETAQAPQAEAAPEAPAEAAQGALRYARALDEETPVYVRSGDWDVLAFLCAGDVVLVTGEAGVRQAVTFNAGGTVLSGFVQADTVAVLDEGQASAYLDAAAGSGAVALYADDLNWPLVSLEGAVWGEALAVMANYADYSNDTVYTLNGVQISANMVPDPGSGRCWTYAQGIYQLAWGCKFSENFEGNAATGYNLLRNLNDAQRKLTPAHLKAFILRTTRGATIRIGGCTSACSSFNNDGLGCGHSGHSLIVVDYNSDGVVTMDSHSNSQHTRFYSWQGFCNAWASYPYVKYIKWPGAPAIPSGEIAEDGSAEIPVIGVALSQAELTVDVGSTAALTAEIQPSDATNKGVSWASSDPSIATVADGVVTGVKTGTVTIGVKTADGEKTAYCTVTVKKPVLQKALSKKGGNGTVILGIGEQLQLSADFAVAKGWQVAGAKSSKPKYATVSDTGLVTALAAGKTKITVATTNKKKATLTVQVVDPTKPTKVALNKSGTVKLKVGDTLKLEYAVLPTTAVTTVAWKSSKTKVATVDTDGNVTALAKGSCTIAVMTANGKYAKVKIKVSK